MRLCSQVLSTGEPNASNNDPSKYRSNFAVCCVASCNRVIRPPG